MRWPGGIITPLVTTLVALLVLVAAPLRAAGSGRSEREANGPEHRLVGEIVGVDTEERTLTVKETLKGGVAKSIAFTLAEDAKVMVRGKPSTMDEIKPGDSVTVKYVERNGKRIASSCDVAKPAGKKP